MAFSSFAIWRLEIGDGGVGRIENLLGLKDVEFGCDAVDNPEVTDVGFTSRAFRDVR